MSQEYWRPNIIFVIASSIWTPIYIDSASNKAHFERDFGHFVTVLLDLDQIKELSYKILMERIGFAFFMEMEYEKVPEFCHYYTCIGHSYGKCRRKDFKVDNKVGMTSFKLTMGSKIMFILVKGKSNGDKLKKKISRKPMRPNT